ncbi:hypothetical protein [Anabaena sp. CCY 9910]|uniref:hypothetical protein n=1 Tax=Anabaena sp. CCY 9910 TaxID=3103870 RepID=UPI0039E19F99
MLNFNLPRYLPSADELPDSDETPVDNELQKLIPGLLKAILLLLWAERMDWFFGVLYYVIYSSRRHWLAVTLITIEAADSIRSASIVIRFFQKLNKIPMAKNASLN